MLGRLGERRPVALVLEDLHRADAATRALVRFLSRIARDQRLAIIASDQPDIVPRDDPWSSDLAAIAAAPRPLERLTLDPLDRDDLAALIEGIEGERASASLLLLVVERSGGLPLVAEELLAARRELPNASLSGTLDALVIARLSARSPECRRVLRLMAPAGLPLTAQQLADVSDAYETETDGAGAAVLERTAPRRWRPGRGCPGRSRRGGRARVRHRARRRDRLPPRGHRAGRGARPAADRPDPPPRRPRDGPARTAGPARPAVGRRPRSGAGPRAPRIEAAAVAAAKYAPADELAALESALAVPDRPIGTTASRRRSGRVVDQRGPPGPGRRSGLRGRARIARQRVSRGGDRGPRRPSRARPARASSTTGSPTCGGPPGDPGGRHAGGPPRRRARPARDQPGAGAGPGRTGPAADARRLVHRRAAAGQGGDPRGPGVRPDRPRAGHPRHHDARRRDGLGQRSRGRHRAAAAGRARRPGARRPGGAVPDHRQPHDRARPRRPADRGGRGRVPGHRGRPAGRPGGGLRQLPARQRVRVAVPAGSLDGGARAGVAGARLAADRASSS